jgi:hypothetical protein
MAGSVSDKRRYRPYTVYKTENPFADTILELVRIVGGSMEALWGGYR